MENLAATLKADLEKIWDSLVKPDELKDRKLSDYFDLSFTALPHKTDAREKLLTNELDRQSCDVQKEQSHVEEVEERFDVGQGCRVLLEAWQSYVDGAGTHTDRELQYCMT